MKTFSVDLRWINSSGVGTYIQGIMPGIVEHLRDVSIVCIGQRSRLEEFPWSVAANVRLIDCAAGRYSLREQVQLPCSIPRETNLFFSPYYTIPLFYRGKLAVTVHDMSHLVVDEIVNNFKKRMYARTMFRAIRRRASLIFTVSDFSRQEYLRLMPGPGDHIVTTHLGVTPEWYRAGQLAPLRSRPYFVSVSNIKPYKNIRRLVEAFLSVRERIPHDLVLVGQNEGLMTGESAEFFDRVRAGGDRIYLTGYVSPRDLLSLVAHADALVMPSLYEGFGLPPVEAMAAGTPVVVANKASLPEVCGDAALYFDPYQIEDIADKLVRIGTNKVLRRELSEKGKIRSGSFRWELCSAVTATHLRRMLELKS